MEDCENAKCALGLIGQAVGPVNDRTAFTGLSGPPVQSAVAST